MSTLDDQKPSSIPSPLMGEGPGEILSRGGKRMYLGDYSTSLLFIS